MKSKSLVCLLDKTYIDQFNIFCFSLLKNNNWFKYDINIFYSDDSLEPRFLGIKKIYDNIIFNKINVQLYEDCVIRTKWRSWNYNPFHRFEIFSLSKYSKIVYMDLDMLVLGDVSFLFENNFDFAAVPIQTGSGMEFYGLINRKRFNGGMLVVSDKYLTNNIREDLVDMCEMVSYSGNQTPLNLYFQDKITFLDKKYNCSLDIITNNIALDDVRILHFIGEKKPCFSDDNKFTIKDKFDEYIYSNTTIKNCFDALNLYLLYKKEFYDKHIY